MAARRCGVPLSRRRRRPLSRRGPGRGRGLQVGDDAQEQPPGRIDRRKRQRDPAHADLDGAGDLEQPGANGAALRRSHPGAGESELPDGHHQRVGEGREVHPQLVGPHGCRRGAVGEQVQLLLLDPVFHVATPTIQLLVKGVRPDPVAAEAGDDETGIGAPRPRQPFRLGDHAARPAPAVDRAPAEVAVAPRRLAVLRAAAPRAPKLPRDPVLQTRGPRQPEHEVNAVVLAPDHQIVAAEARIPAKHDPRPGPALPDLPDNPRHLGHRTLRRVDVRLAETAAQDMVAAENVQRQIAVAPVVAMEETALLLAVQRVVRRVKIQNDLFRRLLMGLEKQIRQQPVDALGIGQDLLVAIPFRVVVRLAQLQTVQCARTRQRMTPVALPACAPHPSHPRGRAPAQPRCRREAGRDR